MKLPGWVIWVAVALGVLVIGGVTAYELGRRSDAGFMTVEGCEVRWKPDARPLPIAVDPESVERIGGAVGVAVRWFRTELPGTFGSTTTHTYEGLRDPVVFVHADWQGDQEHGGTTPRFRKGTCDLARVEVRIPGTIEDAGLRTRVVAHELGHALGLEHDPYEDTLMYPNTRWISLRLTEGDRKRLRQ